MSWVDIAVLACLVLMNGGQSLLLLLAFLEIPQRAACRLPELDNGVLAGSETPSITLIAPAYNEEQNIEESVRAFLQVEYPRLTLLVVNDGSTDGTLSRLRRRFALEPIEVRGGKRLPTRPVRAVYGSRDDHRLLVVDKENGGKADALNAGLNLANTPLFGCVDADSIIERRALLRMVEPYLYPADHGEVVAVGGTVLPANGSRLRDGILQQEEVPRSWLARFQVVEYLRAFLLYRMGMNRLGGSLIISGALGLFLREPVMAAGGYRSDTVGEDAELVFRLQRRLREQGRTCRIVHIAEPVGYTEVPEKIAVLGRQRDRWQRGLLDTLIFHRGMFFRPRYGVVGLFSLPLFAFIEVGGPLVELVGYARLAQVLATGGADGLVVALFFAVVFAWGILLNLQSLLLEALGRPSARPLGQQLRLAVFAVLEGLGYRQLTLWFRLRGFVRWLGREKSWGEMSRQGLGREVKA